VDTLSYKTVSANSATVDKQWLVVDAEGIALGRLGSEVASLLRGKHKTNFTPHVDCGDNVIVINAEKVTLSGNKWKGKEYMWYTGYPGGQRTRSAEDMMKRKPMFMVENAVKGMLPKNKLGRAILKNLYVYVGGEHEQAAQKPTEYKIKG
jgi:large subunit ribosomal protein L13